MQTLYEYPFAKAQNYAEHYGAEKVDVLLLDADTFMRDIYADKYLVNYDLLLSEDSTAKHAAAFSRHVANSSAAVLLLNSAFPIHEAIARQYFPYLIENTITQANNFRVYSRLEQDKDKAVKPEEVVFKGDQRDPGPLNFQTQRDVGQDWKQKGLAVAISSRVVPKTEWADTAISDGDEVLIIKATQGG